MPSKILVFVIDDDLDDQEIFSLAAREVYPQAECIFANDGVFALEKIHSEPHFNPHLILVDINMPRMNGFECLTRLKSIARLALTPIYMYSTSPDPRLLVQCLEMGASGFVQKHSDTQKFEQELARIISLLKIAVYE